ncbi:hypothetical protein Tco_0035674, partial [Tanacetum coccineum]
MIGGAWRDIVKVGEDLEGIGIGYTSSLKWVVGNSREIGFWVDKWLGDVRLCDRDRWKWTLQEDRVFTIKALIRMIEEKTLRIENGGQEALWNKCVPK